MVLLGPVIGGLVSGFIGGVLTVLVRARHQRRIRERQWYDRTIRLAERVVRASETDPEYDDPKYMRDACAGVLGNLTEQLMHAPDPVSDEVLNAAEQLAISLQTVKQTEQPSANYLDSRMADVIHDAESLIDTAEAERADVPRL